MSLSVENLSLLGALAPLRQKLEANETPHTRGFAEQLVKAIDSSEPTASTLSGTNDKARELAEKLTLQMLHNSLSLSGETVPENSGAASSAPFSSTNALLQAYRTNLASGDELSVPPSAPAPSQLKELQVVTPVTVLEPSITNQSGSDTSWLDSIISRASRKYGVDAGLIKAVIKTESNFNPQAVSHAGARGLMQLMPATARSLGVKDSFDPEQNIMAGTRFLKDMLQRYNGDVNSALAAYNWGPGNVDKHPDHLPRETRNYLAQVKQLYNSYNS